MITNLRCEQRGEVYFWCNTGKGWDKCSPDISVFYQCESNPLCLNEQSKAEPPRTPSAGGQATSGIITQEAADWTGFLLFCLLSSPPLRSSKQMSYIARATQFHQPTCCFSSEGGNLSKQGQSLEDAQAG